MCYILELTRLPGVAPGRQGLDAQVELGLVDGPSNEVESQKNLVSSIYRDHET